MEKKTSDEWQKLHPEILVFDPDGWDRKNFQFSWYEEEITKSEYFERVVNSTIKANIDDINKMLDMKD